MCSTALPVVGIDLGGTKIAAGLVDAAGKVVAERRKPSNPAAGGDGVVAEMQQMVEELRAAGPIAAIGVGVAGQVDNGAGIVRHAPNLRWWDFPLRERLSGALSVPVFVVNDVQAATYGEWLHGSGQGARTLVCLWIGTGVGGGFITDGRLYQGATGSAGELGHVSIDFTGPVCRCGNRGCLEAYVGGWAIARRAFDAVAARREAAATILEIARGDARSFTASIVAAAAHRRDPLANALVDEIAAALGAAATGIANGYNPELLILGGGVVEALPELVPMVQDRVAMWALPVASSRLRVLGSALGPQAGALGAAAWARQRLHEG
jgi:glucokinase